MLITRCMSKFEKLAAKLHTGLLLVAKEKVIKCPKKAEVITNPVIKHSSKSTA